MEEKGRLDQEVSFFYKHNLRKQQEELNLLQSALIEREKDIEEGNMERVEEIKIKKKEQKNRLIAKIQRKKIKSNVAKDSSAKVA